MEEEESKIKWSAVFAVIKRRLIWIAAITVTVAILAGVLTEFVYNKGKDVYTVSFNLSSPSGTQSLPDGTAFSVQSLVYADNLNSVKEKDESFANLDMNRLSSGGITVTDNNAAAEDSENAQMGVRYTLTAKESAFSSYEQANATLTAKESAFSSYEQANAFMRAVAENFALLTIRSLENRNYSAWEADYSRAADYEERISVLRAQHEYVLSVYDGLTATRAYADFVTDGYTVAQWRANAAGDISAQLTTLENEQGIYRYVLGDSENDVLYRAKELERQKQVNTSKIAALEETLKRLITEYVGAGLSASQMDTFESFHVDIASLTQKNVEIDDELGRLYASIGYEKQGEEWVKGEGQLLKAPAEFTQKLEELKTLIAENTQKAGEVLKEVYANFTLVEFAQAQAEVEQGGTNAVLMTVAAFVLALIAACAVFALAGYRKQVAAAEAAEQSAPEEKHEEKPAEESGERKE